MHTENSQQPELEPAAATTEEPAEAVTATKQATTATSDQVLPANKAGRLAKKAYDTAASTGSFVKEKLSPREFEEAFSAAMKPAKTFAQAQVEQMRKKNPDITQEELLRRLRLRFTSTVSSTGAAIGGSAALPGAGTFVALSAALGDVGMSVSAAMIYVYSVLNVLDLELQDLDMERALILTVLLGGSGSATVNRIAKRTGAHLGKKVVDQVSVETLRRFNRVLGRNFITKYGTKQGIIVLGKVAPFGIGAALGGGMNYALALAIIKSTNVTIRDLVKDLDTPRPDIEALLAKTREEIAAEQQQHEDSAGAAQAVETSSEVASSLNSDEKASPFQTVTATVTTRAQSATAKAAKTAAKAVKAAANVAGVVSDKLGSIAAGLAEDTENGQEDCAPKPAEPQESAEP